MSAAEADIEASAGCRNGRRNRRRLRRSGRRPSSTDGSLCFSDSDDHTWHSPACESYDECGSSGISTSYPHSHRESCSVSDEEVDLESGELEMKVHFLGGVTKKEERDCRICHLNLVFGGGDREENGGAIELGCNCKGDLGAAHKQCAETWFKIKGNTTCEICGAAALNVAGEQTNEASSAAAAAAAATTAATTTAPAVSSERQSFWQGRRIMNFLLACMVFAFIISWLFHFNVLP